MIGRLLRPLRSGTQHLADNDARIATSARLDITSPAFASGTLMPSEHRGLRGSSPPLAWRNIPSDARALVLIVEDVDVPFPTPLVHAIVYDIAPHDGRLAAGAIPPLKPGNRPTIADGRLGLGAGLAPGWVPVTPIPGHGPHRYVFQLFALDRALAPFAKPPSKRALLDAMAGTTIARGATVGLAEA